MTGPSPLWYTTRGAGIVVMILLSASVVLGILTNGRWTAAGIPRFVTSSLHGNISLLTLIFLVLHILTAITDSFAHLGLKDALIPFASSYRPLWMGLGVLGAELFFAVAVTSLMRGALGYGAWRAVHLLSYASWPLALLHGIGTGSDTRAWWSLLINAGCVAAVVGALAWRVLAVKVGRESWRTALTFASVAGTVAVTIFLVRGPLQPGWALAAGTPRSLLSAQSGSTSPSANSAYVLPAGLHDQLRGSVQDSGDGGARVILSDVRDPALQVVIIISDPQASSVGVALTHGAQSVCSTRAQVGGGVSATCGSTALDVEQLVESVDGSVQATLVTRAA
jgi:sulfoxide reductase heme-binding subunit YedZ